MGKGILWQQRLEFKSPAELRAYYEAKYAAGGYEGGYIVRGVNVSDMYHDARREVAWRLMEPGADDHMLDAGCGRGVYTARLASACREVTAIDVAENSMDQKYRVLPNVHFRQMDVEALTFADQQFSAVMCIETLEHLMWPETGLQQMSRVLKAGGRMVLTYPLVNQTLVKRLRLGLKLSISEHLNEWTLPELLFNLQSVGLAIESVEGIAFDFGYVLALKQIHASFARGLTRLALALPWFPGNSQFVAVRARKW